MTKTPNRTTPVRKRSVRMSLKKKRWERESTDRVGGGEISEQLMRTAVLCAAFLLVWSGRSPTMASAQVPDRPARRQQQQAQVPQEGITLNFQNLDLGYVVTAMGQAAGINVVSTDMPDVLVTLRTAQPVTREEVASLIRSLALAHGVAVTEEPGFLRLQGPAVQEEGAVEPRQLYIHRLQHANAVALAATLQALFGGSAPLGSAARSQGAQTLSQQLQAMEQQATQSMQGTQAGGQGAVTFQVASGELEGDVQIVPDEITNSLLVRATSGDWGIIEQAIQALDLRPLQVVIEVVIAEVRRTGDLNVGMDFFASDVESEGGEGTTVYLPGPDPTGSFTLDVLRTGDVDVGATLSALAASGNVRILSRPLIQAQNNQEAHILVGSERPFIQASYTTAQNAGVSQEIVQYRDVGTALTILPTINEDGYVNLVVTQEVSSATAETQFGAPVISTREATTQILARTGQTVVIGGLVDQQREESRTGIPLLKDIPILGYLFGTTRESVTNAELFLFLTPFVVANDADERRLREELEGNVDLLRELVPIKSMLPPSLQDVLPDSLLPDTLLPDTIRPDTIRPDTSEGGGSAAQPDLTAWPNLPARPNAAMLPKQKTKLNSGAGSNPARLPVASPWNREDGEG